ncbi:MAG: hypothetical protein O7D32_11775, partial [bacterium]|nr:hypothetical protein [bacterium]
KEYSSQEGGIHHASLERPTQTVKIIDFDRLDHQLPSCSAKPLFPGSNPGAPSISFNQLAEIRNFAIECRGPLLLV